MLEVDLAIETCGRHMTHGQWTPSIHKIPWIIATKEGVCPGRGQDLGLGRGQCRAQCPLVVNQKIRWTWSKTCWTRHLMSAKKSPWLFSRNYMSRLVRMFYRTCSKTFNTFAIEKDTLISLACLSDCLK